LIDNNKNKRYEENIRNIYLYKKLLEINIK